MERWLIYQFLVPKKAVMRVVIVSVDWSQVQCEVLYHIHWCFRGSGTAYPALKPLLKSKCSARSLSVSIVATSDFTWPPWANPFRAWIVSGLVGQFSACAPWAQASPGPVSLRFLYVFLRVKADLAVFAVNVAVFRLLPAVNAVQQYPFSSCQDLQKKTFRSYSRREVSFHWTRRVVRPQAFPSSIVPRSPGMERLAHLQPKHHARPPTCKCQSSMPMISLD